MLSVASVVSVAAVGVGISTQTHARTDSAPYQLAEKMGAFEIREYPELALVSTPMAGEKGMNSAFSRLFRYISGDNAAREKISMTTPVFMDRGKSTRTMSFVMPQDISHRVPGPLSDAVKSEVRPAGRWLVYRYSGFGTETRADSAVQKLRNFAAEKHLATQGEPVVAYYDPPWAIPFLRRNEVMMQLADTHLSETPGSR